jgi:putative MATE family efflux protein
MKELFSKPWSRIDFIKYVTPSALSLLSISLYMAVDMIFISRFAGTLAMASVNIIMPLFSLVIGIGIMMSAGASAIMGIELGEGKHDQANGHFSLVFWFLLGVVLLILTLGYTLGTERISLWLGATDKLLPYCVEYLDIYLIGIAALVLQMFFEFTIRLDGKPYWAFYTSLVGGGTNIILDYIFIVEFGMGIRGAAIASSAGIIASCLCGASYFIFRPTTLKMVHPITDFRADFRFLMNAMINGSSEMVTEISSGVKTLVFNYIIIKYAGEAGVAAMSILMCMFFLMSSLYIGLSMGVSPVISFNFGSKNFTKIRELLSLATQFTLLCAVFAFVVGIFYGDAVIQLFAKGQDSVVTIAEGGIKIVAFTFLINGLNILGSAFFTAVNNGKISALIAALRTFAFTFGFVAILPFFMGLNGVWFSLPAAELATLVVTLYFVMKYRNFYIFPDRTAMSDQSVAESHAFGVTEAASVTEIN